MNKLKKELIDSTIEKDTIPFDSIDNLWVIILDGKLFAPAHGTCFFTSKEGAWKCWYNQTNYRIKQRYKSDIAKQAGANSWWDYHGIYPMRDREVWETFKSQLFEDYGLKIIQWKDAKRDVCGQSRA